MKHKATKRDYYKKWQGSECCGWRGCPGSRYRAWLRRHDPVGDEGSYSSAEEQLSVNQQVGGSSPSGSENKKEAR